MNHNRLLILTVGIGICAFVFPFIFIKYSNHGVNAGNSLSTSPSKYSQCVLEEIKAREAADEVARDRFVRESKGMTNGELLMLSQIFPAQSAADISMARRASFMLIKETCRLKFPCAEDEEVSQDYNTCLKRQPR
jgi:hypothetical protein